MSNENSLGWLWVWLRRVAVHAIFGTFAGAFWGAISVCAAGVLISLLLALGSVFSGGSNSDVFRDLLLVGMLAGLIGLAFGAVAGGVGGFVSWLVMGSAASSPVPSPALFKRTGWTLFGGAMSGVCGYVTWCLWHSLKDGKSFAAEFFARHMEAAFGVSAWMTFAHLAAMLVLANRTASKPVANRDQESGSFAQETKDL